ncbi:hypothetical protein [Streptomyces sp. NPDC056600]|uniref:hypothetical protein n=1 Tax=Streptomyces sp. NPDC056600 TaxID=3345874 RepID=UPI00367DC571
MTDRDFVAFILGALIGGIGIFLWTSGHEIGAVAVVVLLGSHLWDWMDEPDHGQKRPVLTVFGEAAGIVGCGIALLEFLNR